MFATGPVETSPGRAKLLSKYVAALALLTPFVAAAQDDAYQVDMSCAATVREFFTPLVQQGVINTKAISIDPKTSMNHFDFADNKQATAYGMPVKAFFGYADEPLLFLRGMKVAGAGYGVIVNEGVANVQAQLNSFGATRAKALRIKTDYTAIACEEKVKK